MSFNTKQLEELGAKLDRANVSTRSQSGRSLSYIEGWWAISEANRIFGFDAWSSQTVEIKCVAERERAIGQQGTQGWGVSYIAKVRVTVDEIVREGVGSGHGIDRDLGLAHESAIKEAETDARKRALMTFGNPFGLALYDKTQENVSNAPPSPPEGPTRPPEIKRLTSSRAKEIGLDAKLKDLIEAAKTGPALDIIESQFDALTAEYPLSWLDSARNLIILRREELRAERAHAAMDAEYKAVVA